MTDERTGVAIALSVGAMAVFGLVDNLIGLAAETGSLWQFHMLRSLLALVFLAVAARAWGVSLRSRTPRALAGRTVFAGTSMVIYFGCLGYMPIAQVVAGLFTAPLFVVVFSTLIWKEQIGPRRIIAVLFGFAGIFLVLRPDTTGFGPLTLLPVLAGAFHALGTITTRRWCGEEGTLTVLGAFFLLMFLVGFAGVLGIGMLFPDPPSGADGFVFRGWTALNPVFASVVLAQAVGSLIAVGMMIRSYQLAEPSFIAVFENALIVFATLWALLLWDEWPRGSAVVGIGLIIIAGIIIAIRTQSSPAAVRAEGIEGREDDLSDI